MRVFSTNKGIKSLHWIKVSVHDDNGKNKTTFSLMKKYKNVGNSAIVLHYGVHVPLLDCVRVLRWSCKRPLRLSQDSNCRRLGWGTQAHRCVALVGWLAGWLAGAHRAEPATHWDHSPEPSPIQSQCSSFLPSILFSSLHFTSFTISIFHLYFYFQHYLHKLHFSIYYTNWVIN